MEKIINIQLPNQNKVCYKFSTRRKQTDVTKGLSMRFIFSGNEIVHTGKKSLNIFPDTFLVMTDGTEYTEDVDPNVAVTSLSINYSTEYVREFYDSRCLYYNKHSTDFAFNQSAIPERKDMIKAFRGNLKYTISHLKNHLLAGQPNEMLVDEYLYQSLHSYNQQMENENLENSKNINTSSEVTRLEILRRVGLAKEYLYSNYNSNINLKELASYSCLSVTHLIRSFKQAYNTTPHQFLIKVRLQRAKFLLKILFIR